jgi:hypothetical protein
MFGGVPVSDLVANPAFEPYDKGANETPENTGDKPMNHQLWLTLLPFLITAITFLLSFAQQFSQHAVEAKATRDSEWRKALQQVSSKESEIAIQGAYEMESFLDDEQHGQQAMEIAAASLPNVTDKRSFDLIFFNLIKKADQKNQSEFIAVDVAITEQLRDDYFKAIESFRKAKRAPSDTSFDNFVMHPDQFYRGDSESEKLADVLTKTWELESVSHGLADLWSSQALPKISPDGHRLNEIVLLNNDYSAVDFSHTKGMTNALFVGDCKVDQTALPAGVTVDCATPAP